MYGTSGVAEGVRGLMGGGSGVMQMQRGREHGHSRDKLVGGGTSPVFSLLVGTQLLMFLTTLARCYIFPRK